MWNICKDVRLFVDSSVDLMSVSGVCDVSCNLERPYIPGRAWSGGGRLEGGIDHVHSCFHRSIFYILLHQTINCGMMTVHCWSNAQFGSTILCCFLWIYCSQIDAFWISTDRSFWHHHHRYKVPNYAITTSRAPGLYSENSSSMRSRYAVGSHPLKSAEVSESFGEMEKSQDAEEFVSENHCFCFKLEQFDTTYTCRI